MGRSNTIANEARKNKEFNEFLEQKDKELDERLRQLKEGVNSSVEKYYSQNEWNNKPVLTYAKKDWQTTSTWSMDNVVNIVREIGKAISGGGASDLPSGNETPPDPATAEKIKENQPAIKSSISNIEETAISLVCGIMQSFKEVNSITSTQVVRDLPLGYGLHLFFGMEVSVYSRKQFFHNDFIQQYSMFFTVRYSLDEQISQTKMDIAKTLQFQIEINNSLKIKNSEVFEKNATKAIEESSIDMYESAERFQKLVNKKLDESNAELLIKMNELIKLHVAQMKLEMNRKLKIASS
ncbi:hypothetical protein [Pectobacterium wasabiae]|uniref:Uncharacterized protein n=1 Tax=Pectobacterium wasabiae TaxID=55208 RepID=A0AAW3EFW0_9GAMM|nr:hypothetical protein [Pectobacterium wasabiae]AOR65517.1 hypothetical protein A7983_20090 [Pectobacterium wasabiae CFBP 3304]EJS94003.1 Hypothetical protein Y17_2638 [Pectobacterium wasabiae CFBP 3304]KFX05743.1 hypothetical protein JV38_13790 [Pectobacterium wasabiae]KGA30597.1 hypothetical protein KU73_01415 [Pectobacterium wasabiae]